MADTFSANAKLEGYKKKVEKMLKKMAKEKGLSKITFAEALRILIDKELG
jgi:hypothetical protein